MLYGSVNIPEAFVSVSVALEGLQPDTSYRLSAVARDALVVVRQSYLEGAHTATCPVMLGFTCFHLFADGTKRSSRLPQTLSHANALSFS